MDLRRLADPFPAEEWRPLKEWPGYSVSSLGRVRSEDRTVPQPCYPAGRTYRGKVLSTYVNANGYEIVSLPLSEGKNGKVRVHRLVATAFLGEPPDLRLDVNHKNGKRADNRVENLEWATRSENLRHGYRVNRTPHRVARGSAVGTAKLDEASVREMRNRFAAGEPRKALAASFGIEYSNACLIVSGKTWRHA